MITINPNTILEASMLLCFGIAWPVANLEILRKRRAERGGILPVAIILCGYLAGMGAKLVMGHHTGLPAVFWLYLLNACSVATNLALRWIFSRRQQLHSGVSLVQRGMSLEPGSYPGGQVW